jgi:hypothetical protein
MIYYSTDNGQTRKKFDYWGSESAEALSLTGIATDIDYIKAAGSDVAEEVAQQHHYTDVGAADDWPITVILYQGQDGPEVARFEVDREFQPAFTATEIEKSDDAK